MSVHFTRLTSKSQSTLPKTVRDQLGVGPGDTLAYRLDEGRVIVEKGPADPTAYARAIAAWGPSWQVFAKDWLSEEDCAAFDDL